MQEIVREMEELATRLVLHFEKATETLAKILLKLKSHTNMHTHTHTHTLSISHVLTKKRQTPDRKSDRQVNILNVPSKK